MKDDGGLNQDGSCGGGEQWKISKYAFEVLPVGLVHGLNVGAEEKGNMLKEIVKNHLQNKTYIFFLL